MIDTGSRIELNGITCSLVCAASSIASTSESRRPSVAGWDSAFLEQANKASSERIERRVTPEPVANTACRRVSRTRKKVYRAGRMRERAPAGKNYGSLVRCDLDRISAA
jgi:hypothetical protein